MQRVCSNNTNKLSPQEQRECQRCNHLGSNNTNKLSPQEHLPVTSKLSTGSNNTNKLSPQEPATSLTALVTVQIIQINLALKNQCAVFFLNDFRSNNTNKLSPQELVNCCDPSVWSSNNTNKLSPQELMCDR